MGYIGLGTSEPDERRLELLAVLATQLATLPESDLPR
jgi:hypothetical protein